ncbi:MAG: hypothetical protein HYZ28_03265 [Myxococcales bacterium]|nr:hypothetical protein [Myxococcales bacterium]
MLLNLLDGLFTVGFLQVNVAEEANPLMRLAYDTSPLAFMAAKLLAVQGGVLVLWSQRQVPLAQSALRGAAWLYGGLVAWHLAFLARLLVG